MKTRLTHQDVIYVNAALHSRIKFYEDKGDKSSMQYVKKLRKLVKKIVCIFAENRPPTVIKTRCKECRKMYPWLKDRCEHCGRRQ